MATIKDIAEKANVSLSTVSLIINGKAGERKISRETEERVLKIMREMNYIPNISAKLCAAAQRRNISWRFFAVLISAIQ